MVLLAQGKSVFETAQNAARRASIDVVPNLHPTFWRKREGEAEKCCKTNPSDNDWFKQHPTSEFLFPTSAQASDRVNPPSDKSTLLENADRDGSTRTLSSPCIQLD